MAHIRHCSRSSCTEPAVATMTYDYREATAVIGPLAPVARAGAFDLCAKHALSVTVPVGWQMIRLATEFEPVDPSPDDLTALADAIREASRKEVPPPTPARREVRRPAADLSTRPRPRPNLMAVPNPPDGEKAEESVKSAKSAKFGKASKEPTD